MLENLDQIDWQHLHHAYGEASDVPDLIRLLASRNKEEREEGIDGLSITILHQGTVYEATAYAVTFLVELLEEDEVQGKDQVLILLCKLAHGSSYKAVHWSFEARFLGEEGVNSPQYLAQMQVELSWVKQAHDAVAAGLHVYFELLKHPDPAVRSCVPYTLASLAEHATDILPVVATHLEAERDPQVRASLLLCMGIFATDHSQKYYQLFINIVQTEHEHALVKLAAAIALARLANDSITPAPEVVQTLVEAIIHPEEVEEVYEALPWNDSGVAADVAIIFRHLESAAQSRALAPCLEALKKANPYSALSLTTTLLSFAFGRSPLLKGMTVQDLTSAQKTVLMTLAACERAWTINANMAAILATFGLPPWREELLAFLGDSMNFTDQTQWVSFSPHERNVPNNDGVGRTEA